MGLNHEIKNAKKSRDTATFKVTLSDTPKHFCPQILMLQGLESILAKQSCIFKRCSKRIPIILYYIILFVLFLRGIDEYCWGWFP